MVYKVYYFPIKGAAEVIRQILVVAGQDFEDVRIPKEEWPQHKDSTPFGQVPVLEEDGKKLGQSAAIARYLARKYNLAGSNPWEEAQVDSIADQWKDFLNEVRPFFGIFAGHVQGDLEAAKKDIFLPGVKKHFPFFVEAIKKSGSGFLVGAGLTWVDLLIAEFVNTFETVDAKALDEFPTLREHKTKVHSNPKLAKWIETRPVTPF